MFLKNSYNRIIVSIFLVALLIVSLCGFSSQIPAEAKADTTSFFQHSFSAEQFYTLYKQALKGFYCRQVSDAYQHVLQNTKRENFRGYCAMYVNNLLVYYGINRNYIKGNANMLFSIYSAKDSTDNNYCIELLPARNYSLNEALNAFSDSYSPSEMILVVFKKGATEKGKEFGHVFYVNAVIDNDVIFSESSPASFADKTIMEGEPIVCSIDELTKKYEYYKFDGLVHFSSSAYAPMYTDYWLNHSCKYPISNWHRM